MRSLLLAITLLPLASRLLPAQTLTPSGVGLSLSATIVAGHTTTDISGRSRNHAGLSPRIEAAFATSPRLAVLAAVHRRQVEVDDFGFDVASVELGVRYTARAGSRWRPFGEVGMARRDFAYGDAIDITAVKLGPWVGIGGQYRPRGHWSAEAAFNFGALTFDQFRADGVTQNMQTVYTRLTGLRMGGRYWLTAR